MNDTITIRLPGGPKGKQRARAGRNGFYTPSETVQYERSLAWVAHQAMAGLPMIVGPVRVLVVSNFPVPKSFSKKKAIDAKTGAIRPTVKPDWDNIGKMLDAFKGVVWRDDCQLVDVRVIKNYSDEPELAIQVTPL